MVENKKLSDEDNELLKELGIEIETKKKLNLSAKDERIIAGFEEIQNFVQNNGRLPQHGEDKDIFERLYAIRLEQIRKQEESITLLKEYDHQKLLDKDYMQSTDNFDELDDDELLNELGLNNINENSITNLKYVKSRAEKNVAEEIANRSRCEDFDQFKPLFEKIVEDIANGTRNTIRFRKDVGFTKTSLKEKQFIIIGGQISYIAEFGELIKAPNGEDDARLRVIYANGTESNILLRSVIRAMYKDETSRLISDPSYGPLFSSENNEDDVNSGTIYVLRSHSTHPLIIKNQGIVHKIGVTGGEVMKRIGNTNYDPTFLMAEVELIATYKLSNINRIKLEKLIHNFFSSTKLEIEIKDRFGKLVKANEWFLVPLYIIDQMVAKIIDGTVSNYFYDPNTVELKRYK